MKRSNSTTSSVDSITESTSRRRFLSAAAAIGAIVGTGAVSAGALQSTPSASVTFNPQKTNGKSVTIQSVTMPNGGFVAIHDSRLRSGKALESVIGVSKKLDAGTHENVTVTLFDVPGGEYKSQTLETDQTLIAMPHRDTNGNAIYDFLTSGGKTDGPYTRNQNAVVDTAKITVTQEKNKLPVSVTFEDQTTDGKTANILSVTLSDGGYVAIHDSSLLDGKVIESVIGVSGALDAGTHENVEVTLFEGVPGATYDTSRLTNDQTLIAMVHRDTNDNETYDFVRSQGKKDEPYTKNEMPVTDKAHLTVTVEKSSPTASVTFTEQTTDGTSVVVDSVTMSKGGFVAIHDSSLLDGAVLESVIGVSKKLDAGTHENVTVDLFDVPGGEHEQTMLEDEQKLIAMPHRDTNDNATYDFLTSSGKTDGPYTDAGEAVVDIGCIHV